MNAFQAATARRFWIELEGDVLVGQIGYRGCSPLTARIALSDPSIGRWGSAFTGVEFCMDRYIYGVAADSHPKLLSYKTNTWYQIRVVANLTMQRSDIYVDKRRVAAGLPFAALGTPTGLELVAGHGLISTVWFDNILVQSRSSKS